MQGYKDIFSKHNLQVREIREIHKCRNVLFQGNEIILVSEEKINYSILEN